MTANALAWSRWMLGCGDSPESTMFDAINHSYVIILACCHGVVAWMCLIDSIIIVYATKVIDVLANGMALVFISQLDFQIYSAAKSGSFGRKLAEAMQKVDKLEVNMHAAHDTGNFKRLFMILVSFSTMAHFAIRIVTAWPCEPSDSHGLRG